MRWSIYSIVRYEKNTQAFLLWVQVKQLYVLLMFYSNQTVFCWIFLVKKTKICICPNLIKLIMYIKIPTFKKKKRHNMHVLIYKTVPSSDKPTQEICSAYYTYLYNSPQFTYDFCPTIAILGPSLLLLHINNCVF